MKKNLLAYAATGLLALPLIAQTPIGGLTVAVSQDGSKLVSGGDTRTLVSFDPETLEVKSRKWVGASIVDLAFSKDGSVLAVADTSNSVFLYSTSDWKLIVELKKMEGFAVAPDVDLIAGIGGDYQKKKIKLFSLKDGQPKGTIPLPEKSRISGMALKNDGGKVAVLFESAKDEGEKKVGYSEIPKDLKGFPRIEFQQKNDGKTSAFSIYDIASKKAEVSTKTFFSGRNGELIYRDEQLFYITYDNQNAKISKEGEFSLFQLEGSFNYGIGWTADHSHLLTGGMKNYSFAKFDDFDISTSAECDKLPGWPEYWKGFTGTAGGKTIYGATSAYRVFKIEPNGQIIKTAQGF